MSKVKVKTIDVEALEWFDRVNGNSYFAGIVTVNFGMKGEKRLIIPFQYGYGDHYKDVAMRVLQDAGYIDKSESDPLWRYCESNKIILRCSKHENCKKRELMQFTAN